MKPWLRTCWDQLTLYLPALLMGLFALGTWWLVRHSPTPGESLTANPIRHEADYVLQKFSIKNFDAAGQLKSEVLGQVAQHYPDTNMLEITRAQLRNIGATGEDIWATAQQALASADGAEVQLKGQVHVVRTWPATSDANPPAPMEYRGEFLEIDGHANRMQTPLPVVITQGGNRFVGNAMSYDQAQGELIMRGQVHTTLVPRKNH
jgi:lipopolysaccharide export system protein LptC